MRGAGGLAAVMTTIALVGCGSSAGPPPAAGRSLFSRNCSACHSLSGSQSPRRQGGDLLSLRVGRAAMLEFVREMPVRRPLNEAEDRAIADYVLGVERRRRSG